MAQIKRVVVSSRALALGWSRAIHPHYTVQTSPLSTLASWAALADDSERVASAKSKPYQGNASSKVDLVSFTREEFRSFLDKELNIKTKAADQLFRAIHRSGYDMQDLMNLDVIGKQKREALRDLGTTNWGSVITEHTSSEDGTRKWLINVGPGLNVEAVLIPEDSSKRGEHGTLCLSSQVGCSLACSFCHTGTQPLLKNLSSGQIMSQLHIARKAVGDFPADQPKISNVCEKVLCANSWNLVSNVVS